MLQMQSFPTRAVSPMAFLVLAVLLSLGATADASVGAVVLGVGTRSESFEASDRRAMTQWLDSLTRMAREMGGQTQAVLPGTTVLHPSGGQYVAPWSPADVMAIRPVVFGRFDHVDLPPPLGL